MNSERAHGGCWDPVAHGSVEAEPPVGTALMVVSDVGPQHTLEVSSPEDGRPVQALVSDAAGPSARRRRSPVAPGSVCA
jgi:hypothetical protein